MILFADTVNGNVAQGGKGAPEGPAAPALSPLCSAAGLAWNGNLAPERVEREERVVARPSIVQASAAMAAMEERAMPEVCIRF